MPKFFKRDLLHHPSLAEDPHHQLESPLDTPELPPEQQTAGVSEPGLTSEEINQHLQNPDAYDPVKTLLAWRAPARPFRKRDRSFYTTALVLVVLVSLIALLAGEKMLVATLFALLFLVYVLNFVHPEDVDYKISTQGVTIGDHFYHWDELDSFWFSQKDGFTTLNILTLYKFPGMLILVLGEQPQDQVRSMVARYLPFHEIAPKSLMEKWGESLQKHFPLENPHL